MSQILPFFFLAHFASSGGLRLLPPCLSISVIFKLWTDECFSLLGHLANIHDVSLPVCRERNDSAVSQPLSRCAQ